MTKIKTFISQKTGEKKEKEKFMNIIIYEHYHFVFYKLALSFFFILLVIFEAKKFQSTQVKIKH